MVFYFFLIVNEYQLLLPGTERKVWSEATEVNGLIWEICSICERRI